MHYKKKYLKVMMFSICGEENGELGQIIESYDFNFSYPNDGVVLDISSKSGKEKIKNEEISKDEVTKSMTRMIRTLISLAQTLDNIPDTRYITLKLFYYPNVPKDYEPTFFRASTNEEKAKLDESFLKLKVGSVKTKYHTMNIKIRTISDEIISDEGEQENKKSKVEENKKEIAILENKFESLKVEKEIDGLIGELDNNDSQATHISETIEEKEVEKKEIDKTKDLDIVENKEIDKTKELESQNEKENEKNQIYTQVETVKSQIETIKKSN